MAYPTLGGTSAKITNTTILISYATNSYGIYSTEDSMLKLTDSTITVYAYTTAYGIHTDTSMATIQNSNIEAMYASTANYGLYNYAPGSSYLVYVNNSTIQGANSAIYSISATTTYIGASQLIGGVTGTGSFTCAVSYDGNYAPLDGTCN